MFNLFNKKVDFKDLSYEKVFDVNTNKNDFLEVNFKIDLQYEDILERNYVKIYMKYLTKIIIDYM